MIYHSGRDMETMISHTYYSFLINSKQIKVVPNLVIENIKKPQAYCFSILSKIKHKS